MKKSTKVFCIIILILLVIVVVKMQLKYIIGPITDVVRPGLVVVEVSKTNSSYSGKYFIYSKKKLDIGDIIKVTFIPIPFHDVVITLSNPSSFSHQDYYVRKVK